MKNKSMNMLKFIIDNSETHYELSIEYKEVAQDLKLKDYIVCDCVNSNEKFIQAIKQML